MSISFNYLSDLLDALEEERNCSLLKLNMYALNELYCFLVSPTGFAKFSKADFIAPILTALKTASYRMPFFSSRVRFLELAFSDLELQNINECINRLTPLQLEVLERKEFKVIVKPRYFPIIKALRLLPEPITKRYRVQEVEVESVPTASIPTARISYIDLANEYIIVEDDSCSISSSSSKSESQTIFECCKSNNLCVENFSVDDDVIELSNGLAQPQEHVVPVELSTTLVQPQELVELSIAANQPQELVEPVELFTTLVQPQELVVPVELSTTLVQPQESSQPVELSIAANQPQELVEPVELFTTLVQPQELVEPVELFTTLVQPQELVELFITQVQPQESSQPVELSIAANQPQELVEPVELSTTANQPQDSLCYSLYPGGPLHFENTNSAIVYHPQEVSQQELFSLDDDLMLDSPTPHFPLLNQLSNMVDSPPVSTFFTFFFLKNYLFNYNNKNRVLLQ